MMMVRLLLTLCLIASVYHGVSSSSASGTIMDDINHYEMTTPRLIHMDTMSLTDVPAAQREASKVFEVTAFGETYRIVAQRTNMFGENYAEILMSPTGDIIEHKRAADVQTDCWYNGRVIGDDASMVTLSTCTHETATPHASASAGFKVNSITSGGNNNGDASLSIHAFVSAFGKQVFIESGAVHADRLQSYEPGQHIAYRPSDMKKQDSSCGVTDEIAHARIQARRPSMTPIPRPFGVNGVSPVNGASPSPSPSQRHLEDNTPGDRSAAPIDGAAAAGPARRLLATYNGNQQKYVELLVFNDYKRWQQRGTDTPSLSKAVINQVHTLYNNAFAKGFKYGIEIRLVAMITFSTGDPWGAPNPSSTTEIDHADLLSKFSHFVHLNNSRIPAHDEAHLLSGYDFTGGTVGYAGIGAMCSNNDSPQSTGITQANLNNNSPVLTGSTTAHEMGHNFGMQHDDISWPTTTYFTPPIPNQAYQTTNCYVSSTTVLTRVMSSVSDGATVPSIWSNCSQLYIDQWTDNTASSSQQYGGSLTPKCLENVPNRTWTDTTATCGDGIIQAGEQCDCGLSLCSVVDPCCVQATCMLKSTATCSPFASPCCDKNTCAPATDSRVCRAAVNADCDTTETCNGVSASCPSNVYASAGTACQWGSVFQTGKCYLGDCYSHTRQCLTLAASMLPTYLLSGQCYFRGDTSGTAACAEVLTCNGTAASAINYGCGEFNPGTGYAYPSDGTPCGTGQQCYGQACVASSSLPSGTGTTSSTGSTTGGTSTAGTDTGDSTGNSSGATTTNNGGSIMVSATIVFLAVYHMDIADAFTATLQSL